MSALERTVSGAVLQSATFLEIRRFYTYHTSFTDDKFWHLMSFVDLIFVSLNSHPASETFNGQIDKFDASSHF